MPLLKLHKENFASYIQRGVANKILDERMQKNFDLNRLANFLDISRDELFIYAGLSSLLDRYSIKDKNQKPFETPQYLFMRVAMGNSYNEKEHIRIANFPAISKFQMKTLLATIDDFRE